MARRQPESQLTNRIRIVLEAKVGGLWLKIHGSAYQVGGIPDLIGIVNGHFFGLEVKMPGKDDTVTRKQQWFLEQIRQHGGTSAVVMNPKEALAIVREVLDNEGC